MKALELIYVSQSPCWVIYTLSEKVYEEIEPSLPDNLRATLNGCHAGDWYEYPKDFPVGLLIEWCLYRNVLVKLTVNR